MSKISLFILCLCFIAQAQVKLIFKVSDVDTAGFNNSAKSERAYKKGDLISVFHDSVYAGTKVEPSHPDWDTTFVIVHIPDLDYDLAMAYLERWTPKIDWEVLVSNPNGFRIRAWVINPGTSGLGNITRNQVENIIERFGGSVKSASVNEVVFDVPRDSTDELKAFVQDKIENRVLKRRQFGLSASEIDTIISQDGEVTITKATLMTKLRNKLNE